MSEIQLGAQRGNVVPRKSFIITVKTSVIKDITPIYYAFHHTCSDYKLYILRACHDACAVFADTLHLEQLQFAVEGIMDAGK